MKLLYITNSINVAAGLERVLSIKASYLAEHFNYEVTILCLNDGHKNPFYSFSNKIRMLSVPVYGNPLQYFLSYKSGIQKTVQEVNPDVISVCDDGLKGFFIPKLIGSKIPIIYERHASIALNTNNSIKGKIMRFLMQSQIRHFSKFVVLTVSNIKEWKGNNIIAIPNPLSFEPESGNPLNQKKVIAVGSHSYNKGFDLLLKTWQKVILQYPDWKLTIYGKIDVEKQFVRLAEELRIENSVCFSEPVRDIKQKYLESSIMVLSSRSEGFGMVLIEAMACGVPCVSFDCPSGPRDIIEDGIDGLLVPNGDCDQLANSLLKLTSDEELRINMGARAKQNVRHFLPETIVQKWDELFKELIV